MITLKCKVCGGDIDVHGNSGTCAYCGAAFSLSALDDDSRIENMNRANEARRTQDFDEALRAWSMLAAEDPHNAETRWNLALSRYGIEYVWDEPSADFVPNIHRLRYERFNDDSDYCACMLEASENALVYYMDQANRIQAIQDRLLDLIRTEQPYDVFICFKEQDANGQRTRDSVLAQEIYEQLTAKGLRVFFSRISLRAVAGQNYEPYIFAALQNARVMIVVGTQLDYLTAPWVRNEWSRYLALMAEDQSKYLIPAYEKLPPELFPAEIPMREALDLSAPGALLDLTSGVLRLLNRENTAATHAEYTRLCDLMRAALAAGNYAEVAKQGREALAAEPQGAEAWWMLLLAEQGLATEGELLTADVNWMDSRYFAESYRLANARRRQLLDEAKRNHERRVAELRESGELEAQARDSELHTQNVVNQARALMTAGQFKKAATILNDNVRATPEVNVLREDAELGAEYEDINPKSYLSACIRRDHPEVNSGYSELYNVRFRAIAPHWPGAAWKRAVGGLSLAVAIACGYVFHAQGTLMNVAIVGLILGIGLLASALTEQMENAALRVALICASPFALAAIVGNLTNELPYAIRPFMAPLAVVALLPMGIVSAHDATLESRRTAHVRKMTSYYTQNIMPLEQQYVAEYEKRFAPLRTYGPLKELATQANSAESWRTISIRIDGSNR